PAAADPHPPEPRVPTCPSCLDEYGDGVDRCRACDVPLVDDDVELPAQVDRLLGTFHVDVVDRVVAILSRRGIAHEALPAGHDRVEVVVDRAFRDDLRAELALNWDGIVASLDHEVVAAMATPGAPQPGWFDAPT